MKKKRFRSSVHSVYTAVVCSVIDAENGIATYRNYRL